MGTKKENTKLTNEMLGYRDRWITAHNIVMKLGWFIPFLRRYYLKKLRNINPPPH